MSDRDRENAERVLLEMAERVSERSDFSSLSEVLNRLEIDPQELREATQ